MTWEETFEKILDKKLSETERKKIIKELAVSFYNYARTKEISDQDICTFATEIIGEFACKVKMLNKFKEREERIKNRQKKNGKNGN